MVVDLLLLSGAISFLELMSPSDFFGSYYLNETRGMINQSYHFQKRVSYRYICVKLKIQYTLKHKIVKRNTCVIILGPFMT